MSDLTSCGLHRGPTGVTAGAAVVRTRRRHRVIGLPSDAARGQRGQATVELVGALPLIVLVLLAAGQGLAAGAARELADHAAEAGAVALYESADPRDAARAALPGWARDRLHIAVHGDAVAVRLRPPAALPAVAGLLEASATAHATGAGS